jgi:hypothetical protein
MSTRQLYEETLARVKALRQREDEVRAYLEQNRDKRFVLSEAARRALEDVPVAEIGTTPSFGIRG